MQTILEKTRLQLLRGKTWRYLRYIHLREALKTVSSSVKTVCVCGSGHGLAEVALAIEFPRIQFVLTDLLDRDAGYPNYHRAMDMAWKWRLENIQFSVWNVLEPTKRSFDMVVSTEMLEHIKDDETASLNMRKAAKKYVYCLVPFADANTNCDPARRSYVLSKFGHHVSGYDEKRLVELFPRPMFVYGTYWSGSGQAFRQRLTEMSDLEISSQQKQLEKMAKDDLISVQPIKSSEAQGIKILSHC